MTAPQQRRASWKIGLGFVAVLLILGAISNGSKGSSQATPSDRSVSGFATTEPVSDPAPTGPVTSFGPGTYVVGTDIVAGTYKASGGPAATDGCYWARLKDTTGNAGTIIANGYTHGPVTVTISRGDGAFETSSCSMWKKIG